MGVVDSDLNERYVKTVKISQMKFGNGLLAGCGLSHWSSRLRQLGRIIIRERVTEHFFMELIRDFKEQVIIVFNSKLERHLIKHLHIIVTKNVKVLTPAGRVMQFNGRSLLKLVI